MGAGCRGVVLGLAATVFSIAMASWPALASEWFLMGRHGGCTALAAAARHKPVFEGVAGPRELVSKLLRQGVEVRTEDMVVGGYTIVKVTAPAHGLHLMFVPAEMCTKL